MGGRCATSSTDGQPVTPVAISIDLSDEDGLLALALRRLITDAPLRGALGAAGRAYFEAHHAIAHMTGDYLRVIEAAATTPVPEVDLPAHLRPDPSRLAKALAGSIGFDLRFQ